MEDYVIKNYEYMLRELEKSAYSFYDKDEILSESTERRLRKGKWSDKTLNKIVNYYNEHGSELYPHHITLDDFKSRDLSEAIHPKWHHEQVVGNYICLYLSKRGTGKTKAMILQIKHGQENTLEARAIDIVQNPAKAEMLINSIFSIDDLGQARHKHKMMLKDNYALLRGSCFLHGKASGIGNLISVVLSDEHGAYEMRISTSLQSYMVTNDTVTEKYAWRGGAAIASVNSLGDWPYGMIIGMMRIDYWHPELMTSVDISNALQRMYSYQKKENMLCLHKDIDALWYESFMDIHRQSEEMTAEESSIKSQKV